jgi:2-oxoacid:acceptor oxidoreductase gamma subunit (pyruvate/2-ketoisovalerate family)
LLAEAALLEKKHVQAFPEFGPERSGAPVRGFTRISDKPISTHAQIYSPNVVVIVDPTLLDANAAADLTEDGIILANTEYKPDELREKLSTRSHVYCVNARRIALDVLGRPIYNTTMLGALIKIMPLTTMQSIKQVVRSRFPGAVGEKNEAAIERAYEEVVGN